MSKGCTRRRTADPAVARRHVMATRGRALGAGLAEARLREDGRRFLDAELAKWTRIVKVVNPQVN